VADGGSSLWRVLSEAYVSLKGLLRYKEALFWVIAFPILWYTLSVAVWGSPNPPTVNVGVYNADPADGAGNLSKALVDAMRESGLFHLRFYNSSGALLEAVERGRVDAGLEIPGNFTESILEGVPARVVEVYERSSWGDFSSQMLDGFLHAFTDSIRSRAVNMSIHYLTLASPNATAAGGWANWSQYAVRWLRFIDRPLHVEAREITPPLLATPRGVRAYMAVSMMGVEALFIGLFAGTQALAERKRSGALDVILASPMRGWELVAADTLSALALVGVSSLAVALYSLPAGARYAVEPGRLALAVALLALGTLFTIGVGLLAAPLARTPEGATVIANAIAFPAMFVGGIVMPPTVLPGPLRAFAENWPLGRALEAARQALVGQATPSEALAAAAPAVAGVVVVYALGVIVYRRLLASAVEYH